MWKSILAIALGAALGALLRWLLGLKLNAFFPTMPPGTLAANLIGGYVVGLAIAFFTALPGLAPEWRLLVVTGFCGGLTTFSTFSAEVATNKLGIRGGSAFRAMAGFGHHHHLQEDHFFELAGNLPVEVEFIVNEDESRQLLDLLRREKLRVFYAHIPARFGVVSPDSDDVPEHD